MLGTVILVLSVAVVCLGGPAQAQAQAQVPKLSDTRIVGGQDADIKNYPYQLSMEFYGSHGCGASIISRTWALTAAHCAAAGYPASAITLRANSTLREGSGKVYKVARIIVHPQFDDNTNDYDIALLRAKPSFVFGVGVGAVGLPDQGQKTCDRAVATLTGWGRTSEGGQLSTILQVVKIAVTNTSDCQTAYGESDITARMICAGIPEGGKDTCQGDSGGPMVFKHQLIGVTSWGYGCARPLFPGVYARVSEMRTWIKTNAGV